MKKFFKIFAVLLAFSALSFGFVACSDDDDDDSGSSGTVFTAKGTEGSVEVTYKLTAKDDNTWVLSDSVPGCGSSDMQKGTYTVKSGDLTNGTVSLKKTHEHEKDEWVEDAEDYGDVTITNGKFTFYELEFSK